MNILHKLLAAIFFAIISFGQVISQQPIEKQNWLLEKMKEEFPFQTSDQFSAIEAIGDGEFFLIADDKKADLVVIDRNGKAVQKLSIPKHISSPKWEAMAKDGDDFYVIGAYRKDIEEVLLRFTFSKDSSGKFKIPFEITSVKNFKISDIFGAGSSEDPRIGRNDARVEGLAIKAEADGSKTLAFGIRNTDIDSDSKANGEIYVRKINFKESELTEVNQLKSAPYFHFNAGTSETGKFPFHLSSLEYIPQLEGFLIMTATERENNVAFYGNALWFLGDGKISKEAPKKLELKADSPSSKHDFAEGMKAEGLCLVSNSGSNLKLAIVFDNDGDKTKPPPMLYFYNLTVAPRS